MSQPELASGNSLTMRASTLLAAKLLAFALGTLLPFLLIRKLDQVQFGLYKQVFLIANTAVNVLPLGFAMSAYYFLPREREHGGQVVGNILFINALVGAFACVILWTFPDLASGLLRSPELRPFNGLIAATIWLWTIASFLEIIAVAHQDTRSAAAFIVASQFSRTLLLLAAALLFGSVKSLIYAAILQGVLQVTLLLLYVRRIFGFPRRFISLRMLRAQLSYALPLGFAGVLFSLQNDLHNYFISNHFGPAAFAIYSVGCFQLPFVSMLGDSVGSVMIPRVSLLQKQGSTREVLEMTARAVRKLAAFYFPIYSFLLVAGREFISFLFTPAYLPSWPVFVINLSLIPVFALVFDPVLRSYQEQRYFLLRVKIGIFASVLATLWIGTGYLGLAGVIAVVVIANIAERLIAVQRTLKLLGARWEDLHLLRDTGKLVIASACAGIAAFTVRATISGAPSRAVLVGCFAAFVPVYVLLVIRLRVLNLQERAALRALPGRLLSMLPFRMSASTAGNPETVIIRNS